MARQSHLKKPSLKKLSFAKKLGFDALFAKKKPGFETPPAFTGQAKGSSLRERRLKKSSSEKTLIMSLERTQALVTEEAFAAAFTSHQASPSPPRSFLPQRSSSSPRPQDASRPRGAPPRPTGQNVLRLAGSSGEQSRPSAVVAVDDFASLEFGQSGEDATVPMQPEDFLGRPNHHLAQDFSSRDFLRSERMQSADDVADLRALVREAARLELRHRRPRRQSTRSRPR